MERNAWLGDWQARIYERVRERGYDAVTAFAESKPAATMSELADALGFDVAPIQVEAILRDEAIATVRLKPFAQALLCRRIREWLQEGWGRGEEFLSDLSGAFTRWEGGVSTIVPGQDREILWERLQRLDVMPGWLPTGTDDPIIEHSFAGIRFQVPDDEEHGTVT